MCDTPWYHWVSWYWCQSGYGISGATVVDTGSGAVPVSPLLLTHSEHTITVHYDTAANHSVCWLDVSVVGPDGVALSVSPSGIP